LTVLFVSIAQEDLDQIKENFNHAIAKMQTMGAVIEDPADMLSLGEVNVVSICTDIIMNEFKGCFEAYLGNLKETGIRSLEDLIT
jgi:hypothetical protein